MPDYKEMYYTLFRASEKAIRLLIDAQCACEEMYISAPESKITIVPIRKSKNNEKGDPEI